MAIQIKAISISTTFGTHCLLLLLRTDLIGCLFFSFKLERTLEYVNVELFVDIRVRPKTKTN